MLQFLRFLNDIRVLVVAVVATLSTAYAIIFKVIPWMRRTIPRLRDAYRTFRSLPARCAELEEQVRRLEEERAKLETRATELEEVVIELRLDQQRDEFRIDRIEQRVDPAKILDAITRRITPQSPTPPPPTKP